MNKLNGLDKVRKNLEDRTIKIIDAPILHKIRTGRLSPEEWQEFARQRYIAALSFEPMLAKALTKAQKMGDEELSEVLTDNWRDEKGVDSEGNQLPTGSHQKWRQDFYEALGISNKELSEAEPSEGTLEYSSQMHRLTLRGSGLELAGGILIQEYSIPHEFKWLKTGRDLSFPDKFVMHPDDDQKTRRQKRQARLYLDHHIAHDGLKHHPELEAALTKHLDDPKKLVQVLSGIGIVADARQKFFRSFGSEPL